MVKPSETRQCVLCPKPRDPDSGIVVEVAGRKAWVCNEYKAEFYRIRIDQLTLEERLAQRFTGSKVLQGESCHLRGIPPRKLECLQPSVADHWLRSQ